MNKISEAKEVIAKRNEDIIEIEREIAKFDEANSEANVRKEIFQKIAEDLQNKNPEHINTVKVYEKKLEEFVSKKLLLQRQAAQFLVKQILTLIFPTIPLPSFSPFSPQNFVTPQDPFSSQNPYQILATSPSSHQPMI